MQCTTGKERRVKRWEHEAVLERVQQRLDRKPDSMTLRRSTVEHVFGTLKHWMGWTHFLTKTRGARQHRDEPARAGLQPQAGDRHPGHGQNDEGDEAGGRVSALNSRPRCRSERAYPDCPPSEAVVRIALCDAPMLCDTTVHAYEWI